jgi:hypothetical protein
MQTEFVVEKVVLDLSTNPNQKHLWKFLQDKTQHYCAEWLEREGVRTDYTTENQDLTESFLSSFEKSEINQLIIKVLKSINSKEGTTKYGVINP